MHSLLIVVGDGELGELMEPFYEGREVPEYNEGLVPESEKENFLDYYNEHTPGYHFSMADFEDLYKAKGEEWNDNAWRKGEDGEWYSWSSYNPDSKWDWYEVGGRWAGSLQLKEGVEPLAPLHFSYGWSDAEKKEVEDMNPRKVDMAYLKDIANLDDLLVGDILIDGEWTEIGSWEFGAVKPYLEGLPGDTLIRCVDYHI